VSNKTTQTSVLSLVTQERTRNNSIRTFIYLPISGKFIHLYFWFYRVSGCWLRARLLIYTNFVTQDSLPAAWAKAPLLLRI